MSFQVRALYDFEGERDTAELSIIAGEILVVTRADVGEGWWEGTNSQGKTGLFPEAYVEKMSTSGPPDRPPPILPPQPGENDWNSDANTIYQSQDADGWDDDWDEDTYSEIGPGQTQQHANPNAAQQSQEQQVQEPAQIYANTGGAAHSGSSQMNSQQDADTISNYGNENRGPITKKNLNRFSSFVKSGGESYIYGTLHIHVSDADKIRVSSTDDGYSWPAITQQYTVLVASPKKESKLKGLKSYIAYQLTPSFNNIQVSRRYKHFDWLHERLTEKFCLIPIPPLPDKQISGRYEEHFIVRRCVQLQEFVNWVCLHPVLSKCDVWQHFLTCTDEKRWKQGKRQAEKDQLVGANFCVVIDAPEKALLPSFVDQQMDKCSNFIHSLDISFKILLATALDQTKKHQVPYKREFQKIGESFFSLGSALELDESSIVQVSQLTDALRKTGKSYTEISKMFEEQPKYDWEPLSDKLHLYKGITCAFPDVLTVHRGAMTKRKECEKLTADQKMELAQLNEVTRRTDVISYAVLAEINHFKAQRSIDLKLTMRDFLKQQVNFYQKIVNKLQATLDLYED